MGVTISEIADMAGVSKSLVSNYINGKFNTMSEDTQQKIKSIIEELNYTPDTKHRNFKNVKKNLIGFVVPNITDYYYSNLSRGVFDVCFDRGYHVVMTSTDNNILREKEYLLSIQNKIDGLIISTSSYSNDFLKELGKKIPIVLVEHSIENNPFDIVRSNNEVATMELLEYFQEREFRRYFLFTEEPKEGASRNIRRAVFEKFIKENGYTNNSRIVVVNINNEALFAKELLEITNSVKEKTMIFGVNGRVLVKLLSIANNLNINLSENFQISGYDDFDDMPSYRPSITTVKQPIFEIGHKCGTRLCERIENKDLKVMDIKLKSTLSIKF